MYDWKILLGLASRRGEMAPKRAYSRHCSQYNRYTLSEIYPKKIIYVYMLRVRSWDISVGIVSRLQAERLRNRVSIPGRAVNFPIVKDVQNSSGSHPSPIQFVPKIFSPGIPRQRREADRSLSSGAEIKHKWSCSCRPPYTFMVNLFLFPG
jgi:hypothetical protein